MEPTIPPPKRLTARRPAEIRAMTFDDSDRVMGDRLFAKGQNANIVGPAGVGKSRLTLQIAVCSILERPAISLETRHVGPWLFIQAENSNRRLKEDLDALAAWVGPAAWATVEENMVLHTLETDFDGFLTLDVAANQKAVAELIGDHKPAVAVFDCLQNFAMGDLSKDADMFTTLSTISKLTRMGNPERIPLVLHHALTGKAGAAKAVGFDRASFARNSKVIAGWTRGSINVAPGDEAAELLVIACGKCSNGKEFAPFAVRLNPVTMIYEVEEGFDIGAWRVEMSRKQELKVTPEMVAGLCDGGRTKADLSKAIEEAAKVVKQTAYNAIERAVKARKIRFDSEAEIYVRR